jgi:hypothetical protein
MQERIGGMAAIAGAEFSARLPGARAASLGDALLTPRPFGHRIDNSAGVNTSDVEVNIKIALSLPVRDGRLTEGGRNALLAALRTFLDLALPALTRIAAAE